MRKLSIALISLICAARLAAEDAPALPDAAAIDAALKKLGSDDFEARAKARSEALDLAEKFFDTFAAGLASNDPDVRKGTEDILDNLQGRLRLARIAASLKGDARKAFNDFRTANKKLLDQAIGSDVQERRTAANRLGTMTGAPAVAVLIELTRDADERVRKRAIKGLGDIGNPEALPRLEELCATNEKPGNADEAKLAILRARIFPGEEADRRSTPRLAIQAIGKLKSADAAKFLISKLNDPTGGTVADYMDALGKTAQGRDAIPALMPFIDDRRRAAGLTNINAPASVVGNQRVNDPYSISVGDLAIAAILQLSGQAFSDYGLSDIPPNMAGMLMNTGLDGLDAKTFATEDDRKRAIQRIKDWYTQWNQPKSIKKEDR